MSASPSAASEATGGETDRVRRSARQPRQPAGGRSHAGADLARRLALGADRRHRGDDPALHQPAILAALLHRLHPAQHRIFLSADRADAAVHLPDLSGFGTRAARSHPLVRHPAVRPDLRLRHRADAQRAQGRGGRLGIRRRADAGDRRGPRDVVRADGSAAPHRRLEPAAQRVSPSPSIRCSPTPNGSARSAAPNRPSNRRPPITCCQARACSAFRSRPSPTP